MSINFFYYGIPSYKVSTSYHVWNLSYEQNLVIFQQSFVYMWLRHNMMVYAKNFFFKSCQISTFVHAPQISCQNSQCFRSYIKFKIGLLIFGLKMWLMGPYSFSRPWIISLRKMLEFSIICFFQNSKFSF